MTTLFPIESTEPGAPDDTQGDHSSRYLRLDAETDGALSALPATALIRGRAAEALDLLPAESVRTVVTSPPYWSLRDYEVGDAFGRDDTQMNDRDRLKARMDTLSSLLRCVRDPAVALCRAPIESTEPAAPEDTQSDRSPR